MPEAANASYFVASSISESPSVKPAEGTQSSDVQSKELSAILLRILELTLPGSVAPALSGPQYLPHPREISFLLLSYVVTWYTSW